MSDRRLVSRGICLAGLTSSVSRRCTAQSSVMMMIEHQNKLYGPLPTNNLPHWIKFIEVALGDVTLCVVLCKSHECVCVSKLEQGSTMFWEYYSSSLLDMVFLDSQFLSIRRLILVRSGDGACAPAAAAQCIRDTRCGRGLSSL